MRRTAWFVAMTVAMACGGSVDPASDPAQESAQFTVDQSRPDILPNALHGLGFCQINPWTNQLSGTCLSDSDWGCVRQYRHPSCLNRSPSGFSNTIPACGAVLVDTQRRCVLIIPS